MGQTQGYTFLKLSYLGFRIERYVVLLRFGWVFSKGGQFVENIAVVS